MASLLPTSYTSTSPSFHYDAHRSRRQGPLLKRLFRFPHMDFELAFWQLGYLLISPRRVYRNIYYHKQTKNQWARDDPAFLVLLVCFLTLSALAWGWTYQLTIGGILQLMVTMVAVDLFLVGFVIATITWFISNHFLTQPIHHYAVAQKVEWAYALDVHWNASLPVLLILNILQLLFLPLLLKNYWASLLIGNIMYGIALIWYLFGTFLGFSGKCPLYHITT
ncbi:Protein unc-50 [Choanephora cucurbitarum]|uniref:Protein unc-50 n=1 Tax=Choanephora cucurbitarum TaxID=101091 RepID=A0A1C7N941_9FUNG|nr:Protein unc-50 [Choanephora cucurbitarum]